MNIAPHRKDTRKRANRNRYLNTAAGALRRASQVMEPVNLDPELPGFSQPLINAAAQNAGKFIAAALDDTCNLCEPALWLRRASLMELDSTQAPHVKLHAAERAVRMLELWFTTKVNDCLDFHQPMHLSSMIGLGLYCEEQERPDLTLRFLDIIEQLDPENEAHADSRDAIRARCTPVTISAYIAPLRPGMISPSAVPPRIKR